MIFIQKDANYEKTYRLAWFTPPFKVSIFHSVSEQSTGFNRETALKIFQEIKVKSDILCIISKPITVISFGAAVLIGGALLALSGIVALVAAGIFIAVVGAGILGYGIYNTCNGLLTELSEAYANQSQKAQELIDCAEKPTNILFFVIHDDLHLLNSLDTQ